MKFMKLGSKPDTFYTTDEAVRSVSAEVSSDLTVTVKGTRYMLHKFPLLSKCSRLKNLCLESADSSEQKVIELSDFPGGVEAFELCAKFCYGITITLSAYNTIAAWCAAEYLQMTEDVEKGNLFYKIAVFFGSCLLQGWRDSIVTLQSTKAFPQWSENLGLTDRCIGAIASKVSAHPSKVSLSHSSSRRVRDNKSCNGSESVRNKPSSKGWWAEDIAELGIDFYWRIMLAIKSGGKVPSNLIGDALRIYAAKWLPSSSKHRSISKKAELDDGSSLTRKHSPKHRLLLESVISLLPADKGSVSCRFLSHLLKAANILQASASSKTELARRMAIQLEDATVSDLLIPSQESTDGTAYDVGTVITILEQFILKGQSPPTSPPRVKEKLDRRTRSRSEENADFLSQESRRSSSASHSSKLKVAKIVDGYLQEIARDVNLPLTKFMAIAEIIPEFARPDHDDLYKAIDIYLKEHRGLKKSERKQLCSILDCKRLSPETCMHAAQNESLPLRVVVQVLFHEHARASMASEVSLSKVRNKNTPADDQWRVKSKISSMKMKLEEEDDNLEENGVVKSSEVNAVCMLPRRPKGMRSKLWSSRNAGGKNCS